jgi:MerR family redox-sensitive transcriptional activator SoxR
VAESLTIGEVAARSGDATSALRLYEERGLIRAERNSAGHRRTRWAASSLTRGGLPGYRGVSGATNPSARSVRESSAIGRTSTHPIRAPGILEATWIASFRSLASIR